MAASGAAAPAALPRARWLICCCCGLGAFGRQWWNRDTGYGICWRCADQQQPFTSAEDMRSRYGVEGVHYKLPQPATL